MAKYKRFYSEEDIRLYNEFKRFAKEYLKQKNIPFKMHPNLTEESRFALRKNREVIEKNKGLFSNAKYTRIVPLMDIFAVDGRKALRVYTEEANHVLYFRKKLNNCTPELLYEISEIKDKNGEYVFLGRPTGHYCSRTNIEAFDKQIRVAQLAITEREEIEEMENYIKRHA